MELTSLAVGVNRPASVTIRRDFQYGEWLRDSFLAGQIPEPADDPDTLPLAATALTAYRTLIGPPLETLIAPLEPSVFRDALQSLIPTIIEGITGDERNALLTLERIVVTLESGQIVPKDVAVDRITSSLNLQDRRLLELARDGYRGVRSDRWEDVATGDVLATEQRLSLRAQAAR